jgi:hypothetical protein
VSEAGSGSGRLSVPVARAAAAGSCSLTVDRTVAFAIFGL